MAAALDAGLDEIMDEGESWQVLTDPGDFLPVREALEAAGIPVESAQITMIPGTTVEVTGRDAEKTLALMEGLEDHDDIQHVYANFDIPDEEMAAMSGVTAWSVAKGARSKSASILEGPPPPSLRPPFTIHPSPPYLMIRNTVHYTGHVQGVGFRYTTTTIAGKHNVAGYVQNLPDGRVRLVAEGKRPRSTRCSKRCSPR